MTHGMECHSRRFTGIEFVIVYDEAPTLFIIHKRDRLSPEEVRPLVAYFIMHNRIYQAPALYNVVSNRLLATLSSLQASLGILLSHKPDFTPRTGFMWPIAHVKAPIDHAQATLQKSQGEPERPVPDQSSFSSKKRKTVDSKRQENETLLYYAMRTTAAEKQIDSQNLPSELADVGQALSLTETPRPSSVAPSGILQSDEGSKGGKKRRKRTSVAPP